MTLKLDRDEIQEVRRALCSAYRDVVRELGRSSGLGSVAAGIGLCQRKWKLEALLHQLDRSEEPPAIAGLPTLAGPPPGHG